MYPEHNWAHIRGTYSCGMRSFVVLLQLRLALLPILFRGVERNI